MKKRVLLAVSISLIALLIFVGSVSAAVPASKVNICHLDKDSGIYYLINISNNAYAVHMAHGDGVPGGAVPGVLGMTFAADCTPIPVLDVTGRWSGQSGLVGHLDFPFTMDLVQAIDGSVTGSINYGGADIRAITGNISGNTLLLTVTSPGNTFWVEGEVIGGNSYDGLGMQNTNEPVELTATRP